MGEERGGDVAMLLQLPPGRDECTPSEQQATREHSAPDRSSDPQLQTALCCSSLSLHNFTLLTPRLLLLSPRRSELVNL